MRNTKAERDLHGCLFTGCKQCNGRHDCNTHRFLQASPDQSHPVTHSSDVGEMDLTAEHILSIPLKTSKENKTKQNPPETQTPCPLAISDPNKKTTAKNTSFSLTLYKPLTLPVLSTYLIPDSDPGI